MLFYISQVRHLIGFFHWWCVARAWKKSVQILFQGHCRYLSLKKLWLSLFYIVIELLNIFYSMLTFGNICLSIAWRYSESLPGSRLTFFCPFLVCFWSDPISHSPALELLCLETQLFVSGLSSGYLSFALIFFLSDVVVVTLHSPLQEW